MTMKKPTSFQGQAGRRQLLATLGSLAAFILLFGRPGRKGSTPRVSSGEEGKIGCGPATGKTAKLLAQDGTLVEIDPGLGRPVKKVSNEELRNWIKPTKL